MSEQGRGGLRFASGSSVEHGLPIANRAQLLINAVTVQVDFSSFRLSVRLPLILMPRLVVFVLKILEPIHVIVQHGPVAL
jgi:hypothetical protein